MVGLSFSLDWASDRKTPPEKDSSMAGHASPKTKRNHQEGKEVIPKVDLLLTFIG